SSAMPQSASATHTSFRPAGLVVQSFSYVAFAVSLGCAEVAWGLAFISVHQLTVWLCESAMPIAARFGGSIFFRYFNIGHGAITHDGCVIQASHPFRGAVLKLAFLPGVANLHARLPACKLAAR